MDGGDRRLIVMGGSAGSISVLQRVAGGLPAGFPADILVALHLSPSHPSNLAALLSPGSEVPIGFAAPGSALTGGRMLLAPPDHHLLVRDGRLHLSRGPRENLARPAVDPLFRTAAASWGARTIGVVLSGRLDDGTSGLRAIKRAGGIAIVQDPAEAEHPEMPQSALDYCDVDHVVRADELAALLARLIAMPSPPWVRPPADVALESAQDLEGRPRIADEDRLGERSALSCPECGGVLWQIHDGELVRYRCHTGHAYTVDAIDAVQTSSLESALWSAVRVLRERVELSRQMVAGALRRGHHRSAELWQQRAEDYDRQADVILSVLLREGTGRAKDAPSE